jgi:hypothetical protein
MIPMTWFKLFSEWGSDPKVQSMPESLQRRLIMLWCLRCQADLTGLTEREIALYLHISLPALEKTRAVFVEKGFMEPDWSMPKFEARQTPSDPTAAERMRNYRRRQGEHGRNVDRNVTRNGRCNDLAPPRAGGGEEPEKTGDETGPDATDGARAPAVTRNAPDPGPGPGPDPEPEPESHLDPGWVPVQRLAVQLGGDPSWHVWTRRMAAMGFPPAWVEQVLRHLAGQGKLRPALAHTILERYRHQGGPDRGEAAPRGPRPPPSPPGEARRLGSIMPRLPEGPAGDALRQLWSAPGKEEPS